MSFSVGIIGFPNVGKSTLFKALTKRQVPIEPRPFTTIKPNTGIVSVPDQRLNKLAEITNPEKITPTSIEFVDIAGLVKGAHQGQGLGNQFLSQIRNCDALVEVVRAFENKSIEHVEKQLDPLRDADVIKTELLMKDLETLNKALSKLEKKTLDKQGKEKLEILKKIQQTVGRGESISEANLTEQEKQEIKEFQFLTEKPLLFILNTGEKTINPEQSDISFLKMNLKLEEEMFDLNQEEINELETETHLPNLINSCYNLLDLITFYTIAGGKELRAWTLKKDSLASKAGETVHTDFKNFIKAEIIKFQDLIRSGSWKQAKEQGLVKTISRNHVIEDGDIIEFKI